MISRQQSPAARSRLVSRGLTTKDPLYIRVTDNLPSFIQMGLDPFQMFPVAYDGYDWDYFFACQQLWAVREGLA